MKDQTVNQRYAAGYSHSCIYLAHALATSHVLLAFLSTSLQKTPNMWCLTQHDCQASVQNTLPQSAHLPPVIVLSFVQRKSARAAAAARRSYLDMEAAFDDDDSIDETGRASTQKKRKLKERPGSEDRRFGE